ncbi:hypothetical protein [Carboxylicivirga marina]|uniref:Uncharacterized protein n=1 Tax=Carboxylicivirga marina TaxID=2800988 RepID=A0ABS1HKI0_9BACT|nr:hypothetical protein [Carboxylicivirga marina]MBK3518062.1 hypothetical protein [Carboxylicivirga marina]
MNKQKGDISELVKEYVQGLDPYAEVVLLFPQGVSMHEDIQIYVLTNEKVDFRLEQQYLDARYQVELQSAQSISLYIYAKEDWHKQLKDTPIYEKVSGEGVYL